MTDNNKELALEISRVVKERCSNYPPEIGMIILNIIDRYGVVNNISSSSMLEDESFNCLIKTEFPDDKAKCLTQCSYCARHRK